MGLKDLFFETTPKEKETESFELPEETIKVEPIDTVDAITADQIYERVNLADKSRSIFKI